jgi:uncharacterized membrane protein
MSKSGSLDLQTTTNKRIIRSLKTEADKRRSTAEKIADRLTHLFGSMPFLLLNLAWFVLWVAINSGLLPIVEAFDPFPFTFLTMLVSLEAIVLAIVVLISQNRAEKIADLRQEIDLQVDRAAEEELTKLLHMMCMLLEKHGVDLSDDQELQRMLKPTNVKELEKHLAGEIVKE